MFGKRKQELEEAGFEEDLTQNASVIPEEMEAEIQEEIRHETALEENALEKEELERQEEELEEQTKTQLELQEAEDLLAQKMEQQAQAKEQAIANAQAAAREQESLQELLDRQRIFFHSGVTLTMDFRTRQLKKLKKAIQDNEAEILNALQADLGKGSKEAYATEIGMVYADIDWQLRHLWWQMQEKYHYTPLHEFPGVSKTVMIPYGNVLVMSPWNYPFNLALCPLAEAIAAGNTVILKPGHYSENTSRIIAKILEETFDSSYISCVLGGRDVISGLLDLPFDYIFFTGGKTVGKLVMEKASAHLTPVSLELGGKSPAVVDETANLAMAARRIVFGKFLNAGQTCVAPDYVLVQESVAASFLPLLRREIEKQYPNPARIGKIITQTHYERVKKLIEPEHIYCGGRVSAPTRQIEPTVLFPQDWNSPAMQEEIFGPVLPVLVYSDFYDLMHHLQTMPTPLAFYLFSRDSAHQDYYSKVQPFGSGCINDTVVQLSNDDLPFGGMGASGMGHYHGKYGFATFSHEKAILKKATWLDLPMRYSDGGPFSEKLIRLFLR